MTVTYYPHIATVRKGSLFRLLLRWNGSLYKLVLPEIVAFLVLYAALSAIYRFAFNTEQKRVFEAFCIYLRDHGNATSITFSLGFFVSYVMNRWWESFRTMPWLYTPAFVIRNVIQAPLHQVEGSDVPAGVNAQYTQPVPHPQSMNNLPLQAPAPSTISAAAALDQQNNISNIALAKTIALNHQKAAADSRVNIGGSMEFPKHKVSESAAVRGPKVSVSGSASGESVVRANEMRKQAYEDALSIRTTLMRYLLLGWIFAVRRISRPTMIRFKPNGKLADATLREKLAVLNSDPFVQRYVDPLITEEELEAITAYARVAHKDESTSYEPDHYIPLSWAADLIHEARMRGFIASRQLVNELFAQLRDFRAGLGMLRFMDQFNIPLVYTQVVGLSMYFYFLIVCFSQQFLETPGATVSNPSSNSTDTPSVAVIRQEADMFVPVPSVLYLMFLLGWLRVAEVCLNPFGEDDDDFATWQILNMNVETAYKMINVFELDRVYDGTFSRTRKLAMGFLGAAAMRHRRASPGGRVRRISHGLQTVGAFGHYDAASSSTKLGELEPLHPADSDNSDDSDESDVYSNYFDEQMESIRRGNYEHMRKKYERPLYQGSAIETEIEQNPATLIASAETGSLHRNMSKMSAIRRQIGSALILGSRATGANSRGDVAEDTVSHIFPGDTHASLMPSAAKRSNAGLGPRRDSQINTNQGPPWRRTSRNNLATDQAPPLPRPDSPHSTELTLSVPRLIDTWQAPANVGDAALLDTAATSTSIPSGRSASHLELREMVSDASHADHFAQTMSLSSYDSTEPFSATEHSRAQSGSSGQVDGREDPVFIVGSRRNLNRIVEAIETDSEQQPLSQRSSSKSAEISSSARPNVDTDTSPLIAPAQEPARAAHVQTDSFVSQLSIYLDADTDDV